MAKKAHTRSGSGTKVAKKSKVAKVAKRSQAASKRRVFTRRGADRHELYQMAVQSPEVDADFLVRTFKKANGRAPQHLREDFCGTGFLMAEWARRSPEHTAEGYDIDQSTVDWGRAHNFEGLDAPFERVHFHVEDVREPSRRAPDVRTASNFSWMIFKRRAELLEYFRAAYDDLADGGMFAFDIYGGTEAGEAMQEKRKISAGFTYLWEQVSYAPASGDYLCRIHFEFKDGTRWPKAFEYDWRLWHLTEVVDVAKEAGFARVASYWEGTDEDGVSGDGVFTENARGESCPAWVSWVVAWK
jgi:hypothetical protein